LRIYPLSKAGDFYLLKFKQELDWNQDAETYALSQIGVKYSEKNAIIAFFKELDSGVSDECAAYVREVYFRMGIDLGKLSRPDTVINTAQDLGANLIKIQNTGNEFFV
jgi:hypothetical protein